MWYLAIFMTYDPSLWFKAARKKKNNAVLGAGLGGGESQTFLSYIWGGGGVEYVFPTGLGGGGSLKCLPTTWKCNRPPPPHLVINDSFLSLRTLEQRRVDTKVIMIYKIMHDLDWKLFKWNTKYCLRWTFYFEYGLILSFEYNIFF